MVKQLLDHLRAGSLETLEQIATEAAELRHKVKESAVNLAGVGLMINATPIFNKFAKSVRDRAGTIGEACAARILSEPLPPAGAMTFDPFWRWIDRTTENISSEIERLERKQLLAVAVLAPTVSAIIASLGAVLTGVGILVNIFMRR